MNLTEFLLARYAEDEAVARKASKAPWAVTGGGEYLTPVGIVVAPGGGVRDADAHHIARHDPARVLAEVKTKRRIVELHGKGEDMSGFYEKPKGGLVVCRECGPFEDVDFRTYGKGNFPCATLRALAAAYADHPDYREEWKP